MAIEMPRGLPFSVDTWSPSSKRKRYHFLTHAHKDHCSQISLHSTFPIYTTPLTKSLLLLSFPNLPPSLFLDIHLGLSLSIPDPDSPFSVTAFPANHCPGAVMFLFEGEFGNVLHTGDCRLTAECVYNLPIQYIAKKGGVTKRRLDYLFLDCTFGNCTLKIPSKSSAIQQVINCIWEHPNAPVVYLACGLLGQEEILVEVTKAFGSKIYVDRTKYNDCYQELVLTVPYILTEDASCRFQVIEGFPRIYERAQEVLAGARANLQPEPLFIRPSTQWYACEEHSDAEKKSYLRVHEAQKDQFGVWHVCYSIHSSREELQWALEILWPKWVISTTPTCRAMELDYVNNHYFSTKITSEDPLWKLLNVSTEKSAPSMVSTVSSVSPVSVTDSNSKMDVSSVKVVDSFLRLPKELSLNLSSSSCKKPLTLFGKARLVLQGSHPLHETTRTKENLFPFEGLTASDVQQLEKSKDVMPRKDSDVLQKEDEKVSSKIDLAIHATCKIAESSSSLQGDNDVEQWSESEKSRSNDVEQWTKSEKSGSNNVEQLSESEKSRSDGEADITKGLACNGTSKGVNESIRKLYRSMNVPVPRPLPSLVELMGMGKRAKVDSARERKLPVVNMQS